jgi:hypothetical protein
MLQNDVLNHQNQHHLNHHLLLEVVVVLSDLVH